MKKVSLVLLALMCTPVMAEEICTSDDTTTIVLDPSINGTAYDSKADLYEWYAMFPYGTVYGIATCLNTSGTYAVANPNLKNASGVEPVGGEEEGVYCWCKMTNPARSAWVYINSNSSLASCQSSCAAICGFGVRGSSTCRSGMFGAIGK